MVNKFVKHRNNKIFILSIVMSISFIIISAIVFLFVISSKTNYEWYIEEMNVDKVWSNYTGKNVTIAFLDSGFSDEYSAVLANRIVSPYNIITNTTDVTDYYGHGTAIIIAASGDYETCGIYGIAPDSIIMPIVVTDEIGHTTGENLSLGIIYAVEHDANIVNISLGSELEDDDVRSAIEFALENGVIVVASVGDNNIEKVLYPAKYSDVIAVQSQSKLGGKYLYASWGDEVDMQIPGEQIKTANIRLGEYRISNGSSISAAIMSGIIALMLEKNSDCEEIMLYISSYTYDTLFINVYDMILKIDKGV